MSHPRAVQLVALVLCGVLLFVSGTFIPGINKGRQTLNMIGTESAVENAPPEYAFAVQALGAFRGLLTDIAFIRAEQYKQAGRYYDAMQLADWICKLQPRFPSVWEFQSWNMAWNISVTTHTPEERWTWVYNGVKLIRDEGLRYNPRAVNLYRQIAWIYINKMGESLDDFHLAYKTNWAWRMHLVLGAPPDPLGTYNLSQLDQQLVTEPAAEDPLAQAAREEYERRREKESEAAEAVGREPPKDKRAKELAEIEAREAKEGKKPEAETEILPYEIVKQASYDWIKAIDDAARTLDELYKRVPETRTMVAALHELGVNISDEPLDEDEYWRPDGLAFTFFARYRRLSDPPSTLARIVREAGEDEDAVARERLDEIVGVRKKSPAGQALVRFLQRKVLTEVYKFDTGHMAYLMEYFGPLDWRGVDATGLYWVTQGIIAGGETVSKFGNDKTNTARLIFFALHALTLRNHITFEPNPQEIERSYLDLAPDLNFIEPMHQAYLKYGKWIDPQSGPGAGETYRTGHINFLTRSIQLLYFAGRVREARHYYEYLRDTYGKNSGGFGLNENFAKPLRDYVFDTFYETADTPKQTELAINGLFISAYNQLAAGDRKSYVSLVDFAQRLHKKYMEEKSDYATERLRLNPLPDMQADALRFWLSQPSFNENQTVYKARLWGHLRAIGQTYLLQRVYDDMIQGLTSECSRWNFDVAKAFPEPEGMAEFREHRARQGVEHREKTVETPAQAPG